MCQLRDYTASQNDVWRRLVAAAPFYVPRIAGIPAWRMGYSLFSPGYPVCLPKVLTRIIIVLLAAPRHYLKIWPAASHYLREFKVQWELKLSGAEITLKRSSEPIVAHKTSLASASERGDIRVMLWRIDHLTEANSNLHMSPFPHPISYFPETAIGKLQKWLGNHSRARITMM